MSSVAHIASAGRSKGDINPPNNADASTQSNYDVVWSAVEKQRDLFSLPYRRYRDANITGQMAVHERNRSAVARGTSERISELTALNTELSNQVAQLTLRNRRIMLISGMNNLLQTSSTEADAYSIVSEAAIRLFPEKSGAIFAFDASSNMLKAAAVWGSSMLAQPIVPPYDCWALWRGKFRDSVGRDQRCHHAIENGNASVCLPLLAQGETWGILHLRDGTSGEDKRHSLEAAEECKLERALANSIGRGLGNLRLREVMRDQSMRDSLTGLFNRRYMEEALAQEQRRAIRNNARLAVIMIDIDNFKRFNDDYGHDGGDAVLCALGEFFRKHVRGSDIACRYGGEEFILILSPSTADGALRQAEKIREEATCLRVQHLGQDLGAITLSLGVATFPDHGASAAEILKAADRALYAAKKAGRNRVVMFAEKVDQVSMANP